MFFVGALCDDSIILFVIQKQAEIVTQRRRDTMKRVLPDISFTVAVFLLVLCMAAQAATPANEGKEVFNFHFFLYLILCIYFFISLQFILFQTGGKKYIYAFSRI